jgi:hypothetical protein
MAGVWLLDRRSNTATKSEFITEEPEHFGIEQKVARTSHRAVLLPVSPASRTAMVEDLLAERGILVSYETVRRWVHHFGPKIAADLRKHRPKPHTVWHLDEVHGRYRRLSPTGKNQARDRTAWLPFLDTYRTMCLAPKDNFRRVVEEVREMRLAA